MSSLRRLPTELWLCAWDFLQPTDRLAASHVCRLWRAIALRTRSLWTNVEFCARSRYAPGPGAKFDPNAYVVRSNLPLLREVLGRSGSLSLKVAVSLQFATEMILPALAAVLGPHAGRITALHFRGSAQQCHSLLDSLSCLPALREITTERGMVPHEFTHFAPTSIQLPGLVHLELSERVLLPPAPAVLPSLRTLSMTVPRLSYVERIVEACPSLRRLQLNMRFANRDDCITHTSSERRTIALLGRIPEVMIVAASRECSERLRASLCGPNPVEPADCANLVTPGSSRGFSETTKSYAVSRKWRELCISTPRLWTYLVFDYDVRYYDIVKRTIARSRNLPLHVKCLNPFNLGGECKYDTPPDAWELLQTNMRHIRHLEIEWGTLYYQPILPAAPILEIVRYEREAMEPGLFMVPSHRGGDGAPFLHTLEVSHFLLPHGCQPFRALRNFRGLMLHRNDAVGDVWGYSTDARDLFELFPALEVLRLRDVRTESLLPEGAFPPGLQVMYLESARDEKRRVEDIVRYAPFLRGCTSFPLRHLYLADADRLEPIVAYYIREVGAVDRLAILSSCKTMFDSTVVLCSKEKPARLDVTISSRTLITTTTLRASLSLMVALRHFTCSAQLSQQRT